jgi:sorbitol-6-phosphate 2-dehydrogenase
MLMQIIPALRMLYSLETGRLAVAAFCTDGAFAAQSGALVMVINEGDNVKNAFEGFKNKNGAVPRFVEIKGVGFVTLGHNKHDAEAVKKQTVYTYGGTQKRLAGKIAVVTGGAQGFGKGIAESLAEEGAYVVIADINGEGAAECSRGLNQIYGEYCSIPITVDVTNETSVAQMVRETVLTYGGLDIFIANAGVVRSGNVFELTKKDFDFVTAVNYTAFFLCARHAAAVMKTQHETAPQFLADIVEINSKSGLEGSNKNFAYAGSKFGGIGLVQSFALEFIEYGIKVNAVCPGNYLDGPLWADPENGLFKQYLDAGKVKGARTIADVRKYYEDRVPMKRGCEIADVARAILYAVGQQYETGQAIPVTGGQVMLK